MKKFTKNIVLLLVLAAVLMTGIVGCPVRAEAKDIVQKDVVISKLGATELQGRKVYMASDYLGNIEWENLIGAGKKQTFAMSSDCDYYLIDYTKESMPNYRVSRKAFLKRLKGYEVKKLKENGKTYYSGMACSLDIKNGKVTKVSQLYQP